MTEVTIYCHTGRVTVTVDPADVPAVKRLEEAIDAQLEDDTPEGYEWDCGCTPVLTVEEVRSDEHT